MKKLLLLISLLLATNAWGEIITLSCVCTSAFHFDTEKDLLADCYVGQEVLAIDTNNKYFIKKNKKTKYFIFDTSYIHISDADYIEINRVTLRAEWHKKFRDKSYINYYSQCKKSDRI